MAFRFKLIICIALLSAGAVQAEDEAYFYGKLGTGFPDVVNLGVGRREFVGCDGYDVSLSAGTVQVLSDINLKALYLYRFSPEIPSSYYFGVGGGVNYYAVPGFTHIILPSLEGSFGKSWTLESGRKTFLQLAASVPIPVPWPLVRIEYGISF